MSRIVVLVSLVALICGLMVVSGSRAETDTWDGLGLKVEDLCGWSGSPNHVRFHWDKVVWLDSGRIYYYDYNTNSYYGPIPWDGIAQYTPDVFNDWICYADRRASGVRWIWVYDITNDSRFYVPPRSGVTYFAPRIYKHYVVWYDNRNGISNTDIFLYDFDTGTEYEVCGDSRKQQYPDIDDCRVVYETQTSYYDIQMYDFNGTDPGSGTYRSICYGSWYTEKPAIYKKRVVWMDYRNSGNGSDIYMYDMDRDPGDKEVPICVHSGDQRYPEIHGDFVVWRDYRSDGFGPGIYLYDLRLDQEIYLSDLSGSPTIYEDRVVWSSGGRINVAQLPVTTRLNVPEHTGEIEVTVLDKAAAEAARAWAGSAEATAVARIEDLGGGTVYKGAVDDEGEAAMECAVGDIIHIGTKLRTDGTVGRAKLTLRDGTELALRADTDLSFGKDEPWGDMRLEEELSDAFDDADVQTFVSDGAALLCQVRRSAPDAAVLSNRLAKLASSAERLYQSAVDRIADLGQRAPEHLRATALRLGEIVAECAKARSSLAVRQKAKRMGGALGYEGKLLNKAELAMNDYIARFTEARNDARPYEYAAMERNNQAAAGKAQTEGLEEMLRANNPGLRKSLPPRHWMEWDDSRTGEGEANFTVYLDHYDSHGAREEFDRRGKVEAFANLELEGVGANSCVTKNLVLEFEIPDEVEAIASLLVPGEAKRAYSEFVQARHAARVDVGRGKLTWQSDLRWGDADHRFSTTVRLSTEAAAARCRLHVPRGGVRKATAETNETDGTKITMLEGRIGLARHYEDTSPEDADYYPIRWESATAGVIEIPPGHENDDLPIHSRIDRPMLTELEPNPYAAIGQQRAEYKITFSDAMDKDDVQNEAHLRLKRSDGSTVYEGTIQELIDAGTLQAKWEGVCEGDDRPVVLRLQHTGDLGEDVYEYRLDVRNCHDAAGRQVDEVVHHVDFSVVPPIGPGGGKVTTPAGVEADIPAGALSGEEDVHIGWAQRPAADLPPSMAMHGQICEFSPDGLTFDEPVKITFPLPAQHRDNVSILRYDAGNQRWEDLGGTVEGDTIWVEVDHFCIFGTGYSTTDGEHYRPVAVANASPKKVAVGESVTLDGSESYDEDEPPDTLWYRWDFESDGTWDTSWSTDATQETSYDATGAVMVTLEVKDNADDDQAYFDTDQCTVYVGVNSTPKALFDPNKEEYYLNEEVKVDASGSYDDDGDDLEYRWDWTNDGEYDTGWSSATGASTSYATGGTTYVIKLQVRDEENETDTYWRIIRVRDETAIRLDSFAAVWTRRGVEVRWVTGSEIGTAGFNIWRSDGGRYRKVNTRLIRSKGSPSVGASYSYLDTTASRGKRYIYRLEEIETTGKSRFYGPISVGPEARPLQAPRLIDRRLATVVERPRTAK